MSRCLRHCAARTLLLATTLVAFGGGFATIASADVTTDMNNWFVDTSYDPYGSQFTISSGGPHTAQFRWLDSPNQATNIFASQCSDNNALSSTLFYGVGDTSYQSLFTAGTGTCFRLWGATTSGSMTNHDGRVSR
jgi:hypothetical protein